MSSCSFVRRALLMEERDGGDFAPFPLQSPDLHGYYFTHEYTFLGPEKATGMRGKLGKLGICAQTTHGPCTGSNHGLYSLFRHIYFPFLSCYTNSSTTGPLSVLSDLHLYAFCLDTYGFTQRGAKASACTQGFLLFFLAAIFHVASEILSEVQLNLLCCMTEVYLSNLFAYRAYVL